MFSAPSFSRLCARLLLLVMLATVFSPSFAWEIVDGTLPHDAAATVHASAENDGDCHGHAMPGDSAPVSDLNHHCCPGHVLGHLPGSLTGMRTWLLPQGTALRVARDTGPFATRTPEGLDRPPRVAA